ncbi:MAG: ROK family protein [Candidatus Humimicrobiaceae bacterium]
MKKNLISLKEINKKNILKIIIEKEIISRVDISKLLKISRPTTSAYINELIYDGLIKEAGKGVSAATGGKKATLLKFNSKAGYILSISIGVTSLKFAITDLRANIIESSITPTEEWLGPEIIIEKIIKNIEKLISKTKIKRDHILGIGIKGPGLIDSDKGIVIFFPNLTDWNNINLKKIIEERIGIPAYIDNECRILSIAEKIFGIAKNIRNFVVVLTGIGIGTGIFIDNKLFVGNKGIAGEVGHIITDLRSEKLCHCGNYGCLETLCSSRALIENIKKDLAQGEKSVLKFNEDFDIDDLVKPFKENDPLVLRHVTENARLLGIGLSNIIKMFNPELVVIHGKFVNFGEKYLDILKEAVSGNTFPKVMDNYNIQFTRLPENAGIIGAAVFAFEKIFKLENLNISDEYMVKKDFQT